MQTYTTDCPQLDRKIQDLLEIRYNTNPEWQNGVKTVGYSVETSRDWLMLDELAGTVDEFPDVIEIRHPWSNMFIVRLLLQSDRYEVQCGD